MKSTTPQRALIVPAIPINGLRTLPAILNGVRAASPSGLVLSVYLDTSATRVMAGGHVLGLRACAKRLRTTDAVASPESRRAFEEALEQVEAYFQQVDKLDYPGWACFASNDHRFFYATPLPAPVSDRIIWSAEPAIEPLEQALDEHERVTMLVIDSEQSRVFSLFLGEIERVITIDDYVEPKHHGGGWLALKEKNASRRHDQQLLRHVRHTIQVLTRELRQHPFDRLIVGGQDEAASLLIRELPATLAHRLAGQAAIAPDATHAEIAQIAYDIAEQAERREELLEVERLIEAAGAGRACAGVSATLDALAEQRVQRILMAGEFAAIGGRCESCERLVLGLGPCPVCGAALTPIQDMREEVVSAARGMGATVEFVDGQAGDLLMEQDGLAAWTYFE